MQMEKAEHFGVLVKSAKYGLKLTRDKYAIINTRASLPKFENLEKMGAYADSVGRFYTEEWCQEYQKVILENYDLSMLYFESLDRDEFNSAIDAFLEKNKDFKEITDLKDWICPGYYVMVLDEYKQVYIGTADCIKRRIQQHWANRKEFDRMLFPMYAVTKSVMSIDSFRALDTTRIYAKKSRRTYISENRYIKDMPIKFICNRIGGGRIETRLDTMNALALTKDARDMTSMLTELRKEDNHG
jgi:hypothetical protein